jgi:hypothetical protein
MEWQPIETAPKSSRNILMFGDGPAMWDCVYVGVWNKHCGLWEGVPGYSVVHPSHWMPLPPSPLSKGVDNE